MDDIWKDPVKDMVSAPDGVGEEHEVVVGSASCPIDLNIEESQLIQERGHPLKALPPMTLTVSGMVTDVSEVQP